MAQKREKEETELKVPESLPLCTPTIPVAPPQLSGSTDESRSNSARSPESPDPKLPSVNARSSPEGSDLASVDAGREGSAVEANRSLKRPRDAVNRCSCSGCRRKLGLMGFRCRCGDMFCSEHRYSDRHDCSYDYKAAGREAIARENPVVKAAKILKVWKEGIHIKSRWIGFKSLAREAIESTQLNSAGTQHGEGEGVAIIQFSVMGGYHRRRRVFFFNFFFLLFLL